jgi:DNA-binding transcriptional LysR family regulator
MAHEPARSPHGQYRSFPAVEHAAKTILWPAMAKLMRESPDINIELINDYGLTDIVAQRYDAGVRLGRLVDRDMIAVRIGRDFRITVVGRS